MIRFHAFGVRFSLPLLTLIVPVLANRLGMRGGTGALLLALAAHELAHIAAAKPARVAISEIRLMPFGGSARMENPYRLAPGQLICVAIAGPIMNLALALLFAALAQWSLLDPRRALQLVQPNLILFLFNLLPALPLDGGRILYALLQRPLGEDRALAVGIWTGRLLAALLLGGAVLSGLRGERWNLSFILAGIFIIASEHDERAALGRSRAQRLAELLDPPSDARPARIFHLDMRATAAQALLQIRPREASWFVLTRDGRPLGMIDSRSILQHLIEDGAPDAALGDLPMFRLSQAQPTGAP